MRLVDCVIWPGVWERVAEEKGVVAAQNLPLADGDVWTVPAAAGHVDEPTAVAHARSWGLLAFAFLDDLEPGAGRRSRLLARSDDCSRWPAWLRRVGC